MPTTDNVTTDLKAPPSLVLLGAASGISPFGMAVVVPVLVTHRW